MWKSPYYTDLALLPTKVTNDKDTSNPPSWHPRLLEGTSFFCQIHANKNQIYIQNSDYNFLGNPITLISKQVDASQGGDGSNLFDDDGQMKHEVNFCAPSRVKNLLDQTNRDVGIYFLTVTKAWIKKTKFVSIFFHHVGTFKSITISNYCLLIGRNSNLIDLLHNETQTFKGGTSSANY